MVILIRAKEAIDDGSRLAITDVLLLDVDFLRDMVIQNRKIKNLGGWRGRRHSGGR